MKKKCIVIFIGGYLPAKKFGGPVTSISNLVQNLGDEYDFRIITHDHEFMEKRRLDGIKKGWNCVGKAKVLYISETNYKYNYFYYLLNKIKPDVIYLSSVFYYSMNLPAILAAKKLGIKIVLAPRGELCENAMNLSKIKKKIYINIMKVAGLYKNMSFHATSDEEKENTVKYLGVKDDNVYLMPNMHGVSKTHSSRKKISGELKIVFLARIQEKKNLLTAVKAVVKAKGNIQFDIYGPMEQPDYWEKCKDIISRAPENIQIQYKGAVEPTKAKELFADYDCFIFPTLSENYGHVIAESLLCGCPVILSENTTPWDDIDGKAGITVQLDDIEGFTESIDKIAKMDENKYAQFVSGINSYLKDKLKTEELKTCYRNMFS